MRAGRLPSIAVLAGVAGALAWFGGAGAAAPEQAGWWFKANEDALPIDVPAPHVPDGGLYVANDPSGPASVSALRLGGAGAAGGTLTLTLADGDVGEPLVAACPTVGTWEAAQGGKWGQRPEWDCQVAKVAGSVAADGATVTFVLTSALAAPGAAGTYDLVLLPDPDSGTPFQVAFEKPGDGAFTPTPSSGGATAAPGLTPAEALTPASGFDSAGEPASGGGGDSDFSSPAGPGLDVGASSPVEESAAPADQGTGAGASVPGGPGAAPAGRDDPDEGRQRLAAGLLLAGVAGGLLWLGTRQIRAPRGLGGLADARPAPAAAAASSVAAQLREGGIGRFARERTALPHRLA